MNLPAITNLCQDCDEVIAALTFAGRDGKSRRLCGRCFDRAVLVGDLKLKVELMGERLKAQQAQYRRLEETIDAMELHGFEADVRSQIEWAKSKEIDAEIDGDGEGVNAWHGYVSALRWVEMRLHNKVMIGGDE